jgi:Fe-S-cluster containining protein
MASAAVTERDIERLARHFRVKPERILADYVVETDDEDEEERRILRRRENGECVFLEGNLCSVYESRPDVCQRYPHLVRGSGSIASRMWSMVDRASVCPIVYNSLEAFKVELKFKR